MELNVGGTHFVVGRDTLTSVKGSRLGELFSGKVDPRKGGNGEEVFLDRDPVVFNHMINYLRSNRKFLPKELSPDLRHHLETEIRFWKVGDGLSDNLLGEQAQNNQ